MKCCETEWGREREREGGHPLWGQGTRLWVVADVRYGGGGKCLGNCSMLASAASSSSMSSTSLGCFTKFYTSCIAVGLSIYIYICICIHIYIYRRVCVCMYVSMYKYAHEYV